MMRAVTLGLASAALLNVAARMPLGGYLGWVALVPVLWVLGSARSTWRAGLATFIAGLGLAIPAFEGALVAEPWTFPVLVLTQAAWYAIPGVSTVLARRAIGSGLALASFPFLWVGVEYLAAQRWIWSDLANGLSRIGLIQHDTVLRGAAAWSSVSAVSLAVLFVNVAVYVVVRRRGWRAAAGALAFPVLVAIPVGWSTPTGNALSVVAVQGSVPTRDILQARFDSVAAQRMLEPYRLLTERAAERDPDLIVWPETILPQPVVGAEIQPWDRDALDAASLALVGGISDTGGRTFNSLFVWDGQVTEVYRKRSLIPWIESEYARGLALPPVPISSSRLGMGICLDSLYPAFSRDYVRGGATALVYVTNDNFALGTMTPRAHLEASTFRAIETARPMVFAAQSGPSAFVTHRGEIVSRTQERDVVALQGVLEGRTGWTPYVRLGDVLGAFAALLLLVVLAFSLVAIYLEGARQPG